MKLQTHHFVILSLIGILCVINYAIFFGLPEYGQAESDSNIVYSNGEVVQENSTSSEMVESDDMETISTTTIAKRKNFKPVSILHFGDSMFDRNVRKRVGAGADVFSSLRSLNIMNDYDIRMLNLEGPIIEIGREKCQQKAYNFQFATNTAEILKSEGFTSVNIANNHIYDCYKEGVDSTLNYLKKSGIGIIGQPELNKSYQKVTTKDGTTIAILGIDTTINKLDIPRLTSLTRQLASTSDVVMVTIHFGEEYKERATVEQKELAHTLIENGVDAIIGHHPHVIENMEVYRGKAIFYSLGNFIFDQIGEKENQGVAVGLKISGDSTDVMLFPYDIVNSVPTFKSMADSNEWCKKYYGVTPFVTGEGCSTRISK